MNLGPTDQSMMKRVYQVNKFMDTNFKWAMIAIIGVFTCIVLESIFSTPAKIDTKWDACLEMVNKAIPNPNDTNDRAGLLQNCYEN